MPGTEKYSANKLALIELVLMLVSLTGTICTLVWLWWYSSYGFEFTDGAYYIIWIASPFDYRVSGSQFGYFYHFLYQVLDGNIAALRRANMLINYVLAWWLALVILKKYYSMASIGRNGCFVISAAIATGIFFYAKLWILTPSYNSLALQGILLVTTGLLLVEKTAPRTILLSSLAIGVGGWMTFMGKPTTAAALGVLSLIYLFSLKKIGLKILIISFGIAVVLLLTSALYIDGSIFAFVTRLNNELLFQKAYAAGHDLNSIFRIDSHSIRALRTLRIEDIAALLVLLSVFSLIYLVVQKSQKYIGSLILALVFCFYYVDTFLGQGWIAGFIGNQNPVITILSIPIFTVLMFVNPLQMKKFTEGAVLRLPMSLFFFIIPLVFAFGTNANYWLRGVQAGMFWIMAGLVFVSTQQVEKRKLVSSLLILGLCTQLIVVAFIRSGMEEPYRQPQTVTNYTHTMEIGQPGSNLILEDGYSNYIASAKKLASDVGFWTGTPVIDLTGQSPGILYAIRGKIMGRPWIGGGYPGSDHWATSLLSVENCEELAVAWLLVEPHGPRRLSLDILSSFGADLSLDFIDTGTLNTPRGAGGYNASRQQILLRPIRPVNNAIDSCRKARI